MKDFRRLPKPVRPTPFYVLEQGRSVLLVHHTAANEDLHVAQRRLIRKLMAFNSRDAEGSIAVVYSRGYGPVLRQVTIWDHLGERTVPMLSADLEQWIADWFRDHA